jgi:signal transduction histidine kinase
LVLKEKIMTTYNEFCDKISQVGMEDSFSIYKKKRVVIFNRLNAFGLLLSLCWFLYILLTTDLNPTIIFLNLCPFLISFASFILMYFKKQKLAIYSNTLLIPLALSVASIYIKEGSVLLYLIIYSVFPFFYHTRFAKVIVHFLFIALLYTFSLYNIEQHFAIGVTSIFSPLLQIAELLFLFIILFSVKVQVLAYEKALVKNKELLKNKNEELTKLLVLKDQIFTVIAHDIIVPLTSIRNLTKEALVEKYNAEEIREIFPVMADEITKTHDLFHNLLEWSKGQMNGSAKITNDHFISKIATKAIEQVYFQARNKHISIANEIENDITAHINADNILVALRNLLMNAIKYSNKGGAIVVDATEANGFTFIRVIDNGVGMDKEKIKKVFGNDFYSSAGTSAETGNGFGLKICKELLQQNSGTVYCESSNVGHGSTFVIKVPEAKVQIALNEAAVA